MIVDLQELKQVVSRLTGSYELGDWRCDELHEAAASASLGIWRVHSEEWSSVLKIVGHSSGGRPNWRSGDAEDHWYYWRREVLAYQSGLVYSFAGPTRAPDCFLVADRSDTQVALWLEDVGSHVPGTSWSLDRYASASRHLGVAQGEFAVSRPLPDEPWLSRNWLRAYLLQRDVDIHLLEDHSAWTAPLCRRFLPETLAAPLLEMRREQQPFLESLERMPKTVCHLDLHPANLFGDDEETVVIDWSFVGIGAVGEDVGNLVPDSVLDFHVEPEAVDELYEFVLEGHLAGLRDASWNGSRELVDLAMRATIAAKYAWIAPAMLRAVLDGRETLNRRPIEETFEKWAQVVPFLLRCAERARRLAEIVA